MCRFQILFGKWGTGRAQVSVYIYKANELISTNCFATKTAENISDTFISNIFQQLNHQRILSPGNPHWYEV